MSEMMDGGSTSEEEQTYATVLEVKRGSSAENELMDLEEDA